MIRFFLGVCLILGLGTDLVAQENLQPDDPIASVDGKPIFLGELNLVVVDRLKIRDVSKATPQVQQAIAATLVRQHLAMKSLRIQGGENLQRIIDRSISDLQKDLERRGSNLQDHAKQRSSDEASLRETLAWQIAWKGYLKSRMTDKNLRTYFARNQSKYVGGRWDVSQIFLKIDPADQASRDAVRERLAPLILELRQSDAPEVSFAAAARKHSEGSAALAGGRIGRVQSNGDLPGSVMAAVRSTPVGKVSEPVQSPLGLHVVFVHDHEKSESGFEDLTDQSQLRRDATDALFGQLVGQQKDAKISWYIPALKPPANVNLIPK
ncbi:peptidylprolyl isomerase [Planctomycetes bacterium K23_9]|uniref:Peptidylprolyl isomerase n=1 Tax=Stieleria marina TaxID=1930275 RepID=A0A517NQC7_9BACT|nr:peptidylprolyl isomerase [Planctomycetes bacterium K23_9]